MQLVKKKPGALSLDSPKFIWVKVLKRPYNGMQEFNHIMALCNRFNNALESTLAATKKFNHYVLSVKVEDQDFYPAGDLTSAGETNFWHEIDTCIRRFDRDEINLNPRHRASSATPRRDSDTQHRKVPTPPYAKISKHHPHSRHSENFY